MAGKKSEKNKGYYVTYKAADVCKKNRVKSLARHLKLHPNDAQAAEAAKSPKGHVRDSGKVRRWSPAARWMAQVEASMRGFWKAVANGQVTTPAPQPEYANYGAEEQVPLKMQKPKQQKKPNRKKAS